MKKINNIGDVINYLTSQRISNIELEVINDLGEVKGVSCMIKDAITAKVLIEICMAMFEIDGIDIKQCEVRLVTPTVPAEWEKKTYVTAVVYFEEIK